MDVVLWELTIIYDSKISSGLANVWHGVQVMDGTEQCEDTPVWQQLCLKSDSRMH